MLFSVQPLWVPGLLLAPKSPGWVLVGQIGPACSLAAKRAGWNPLGGWNNDLEYKEKSEPPASLGWDKPVRPFADPTQWLCCHPPFKRRWRAHLPNASFGLVGAHPRSNPFE